MRVRFKSFSIATRTFFNVAIPRANAGKVAGAQASFSFNFRKKSSALCGGCDVQRLSNGLTIAADAEPGHETNHRTVHRRVDGDIEGAPAPCAARQHRMPHHHERSELIAYVDRNPAACSGRNANFSAADDLESQPGEVSGLPRALCPGSTIDPPC
jgi:hypothetical protein